MALTYSTGLRDAIAAGTAWYEALSHGRLTIYSGSRPAAADDDIGTSVALVTFTLSGGAFTAPVRATGSVQLTGGAGGSIDTLKVGGAIPLIGSAVAYDTSLAVTANNLAAAINAYYNPLGITAVSDGVDKVTLYGSYFLGASMAGLTVASTATTLTKTDTNFASGTSAANGLNFAYPAASGVITKEPTIWQGTVGTGGTAAWFRYYAGGSAAASSSTTAVRIDGVVATSGGDLNIANTTLTAGSIQTINSLSLTVPAS